MRHSLPAKTRRGHRPHGAAGWVMTRWLLVVLFALLVAGTAALVAWLLHSPRWQYYSDGLAIRQPAARAMVRLVLWEDPERLPSPLQADLDNIEPVLSPDGKTMVFARGRAKENADLYQARWDGHGWSEPEPLAAINTDADELGPALSPDSQSLYFYSDRAGGEGGYDLWVATRNGDNWTKPVNLGLQINSPSNEYDPALSPAGDQLYFSSNRPKRELTEVERRAWKASLREVLMTTDYDIFVATRRLDVAKDAELPAPAWEKPKRATALNTASDEGQVTITPRGDFIYFSSNRPGGLGGFDLYRSRLMHSETLPPENVGAPVNTAADEMDPALRLDGYQLVFSSNRGDLASRQFQLFQSTSREVIVGRDYGWLATLWHLAARMKWMLLLGLLSLIPLLWLLRTFMDPERRRAYSLLRRCLLGSLMAHLLVAFLFSLWVISEAVFKVVNEPSMVVAVNTEALAQERMALEIREQVTALAAPTPPPPLSQPTQQLTFPEVEPLPTPVSQPRLVQVTPESFPMPSEPPRETPRADRALPPLQVASAAKAMPLLDLPLQLEARPSVAKDSSPSWEPTRDQVMTEPRPLQVAAMTPQKSDLASAPLPLPSTTKAALAEMQAARERTAQTTPLTRLSANAVTNLNARAPSPVSVELATRAAPSPQPSKDEPSPLSSAALAAQAKPLPPSDARPVAVTATVKLELPGKTALSHLDVRPDVKPRSPSTAMQPVAFVQSSKALERQVMAPSIVLDAPATENQTYLMRDPTKRARFLQQLGGSDETEAAITRALDWFTRHQEPDGHWSIAKYGGENGRDVAATGLAMLCYMGWGATHTKQGPHQAALSKAMQWMVKQVADSGAMPGNMYDQGIAVIALSEAYGLTKDEQLRPVLEKAVDYILKAQHPQTGGWRYTPGDTGDTSVFGWQIMALKSAELSGLTIPPAAFDKGREWLRRVGGGQHGGLYGYTDTRSTVAMSAEGMFCQQLMGVGPNEPRMQETARYLNTSLPQANMVDFYFWYYGTLALYQHQGPIWEDWNKRMRPIFLARQLQQGEHAGSWNPEGQWAQQSGRVVSTALATLSLEVYYRYLPMYGNQVARAK